MKYYFFRNNFNYNIKCESYLNTSDLYYVIALSFILLYSLYFLNVHEIWGGQFFLVFRGGVV